MAALNKGTMLPLSFETFSNIIDNQLRSTTRTRFSINPATGKPNPEVPVSEKQDLDDAVSAAHKAFNKWSKVPIEHRRTALQSYLDDIDKRKDDLASLLTQEQGKPLSQARAELERAVGLAKGMININIPETLLENTPERKIVQRYTPLGVVGAISPWNYPVVLSMTKLVPAIYTGNTVILKPSPFTPYTVLKLVELAARYFPPGVVQVLSDDDTLGPLITEHPGIRKISFTGSITTGKCVMQSCAGTLKRLTLELGGNDPAIVCHDVDIDTVVPKIANCAFICSAQRCMAIKRIYVHEKIYNQFKEKFVHFVRALKVGDGTDPEIFFGPIQNEMQFNRAKDLYASISATGLKVALDGGPVQGSAGFHFRPVIVDDPPEDSRIVKEEPFAPILPLLKWSESDRISVVDRANNTETGLGASVWSKNVEHAEALARQLDAGSVWVNSHFELVAHIPFGGHKSSGIGLEYGFDGLLEYCDSQSVWVRTNA